MFNAVTVPRNPLLVWVPSEAIYVEVKGTEAKRLVRQEGEELAQGSVHPATCVGDWGLSPCSCAPQLSSLKGQWAWYIHQVPSVISWGLLVRATASGRKCLRQTCRCWKWGQCALKWSGQGALNVVRTFPTLSVLPPLSLIDNCIFSILHKVFERLENNFRTSPLLSFQPYCLTCAFLCANSGAVADLSGAFKHVVRYGCQDAKLNCRMESAEKWSWLQKPLGPKMPLHLNACRKTWINSKDNNLWDLKTSHSLP